VLLLAVSATVLTSCGGAPTKTSYFRGHTQHVSANQPGLMPGRSAMTPNQLLAQVNLKNDIIPSGQHARKYKRSMSPKYITIHSTQNYSQGADALRHSEALKNGKLRAYKRKGGNRIGYLVWHYSIDQDRVVQHLPDNEQGEHADFDGPGNNYSLGLEMCENRGNSRAATMERTAKLTAYLMKRHGIPIRNVVPHYHWPRAGNSTPHKNCPHFLLENGVPGAKWRAFQGKIMGYYKLIDTPSPATYQQFAQR
jgi:N-acetylmuramoyl-L-alanine amidase